MTLPGFILRNALRNKRRLALTLGSVTVSLLLLTVLQVILRGLTDPVPTPDAATRVAVRHKVSLANMLPANYKQRIERLPEVKCCTRLLWFGGIYQDERNFFPQFACDAETLFQVLSEARIDPEQKLQFIRERTACVVGDTTMRRCGWALGDRVVLAGAMWPCNLELILRGVYSGTADDSMLFFHHEYFDELLGDRGFTGLYWVKAQSVAAVPGLIDKIDAEFENSDAETLTETEQTFQLGFVSMLGNIKLLIRSISGVILFTLVLVTAGTMSMAMRERGREIAILKTVGFRGSLIFGLVVAESVGLAVLGGALGGGSAWLILRTTDVYRLSHGLFVSFKVTPQILAQGLCVAGLLGVGSCVVPAWTSLRVSVADGLRRVD